MKKSILFILIFLSSQLFAQNVRMISDSIRIMNYEDRQMRQQVDSVYKMYGKDSPQWKNAWISLENSDRKHNVAIKSILDQLKIYPSINIVGEDASHCFWTLVLHQDKDTALQRKVIELMKPAVDLRDAEPNDYAYLVDRFRINSGKKQWYGTQCIYDIKKKAYVPRPIEDHENVDKRRTEMEMPPMKEYLRILNDSTIVKF